MSVTAGTINTRKLTPHLRQKTRELRKLKKRRDKAKTSPRKIKPQPEVIMSLGKNGAKELVKEKRAAFKELSETFNFYKLPYTGTPLERDAKAAVLVALCSTLGQPLKACTVAGVQYGEYNKWSRDDEVFRNAKTEIEDVMLEFGMNAFWKKIQEGDSACILYFMKMKGHRRGFGPSPAERFGNFDSNGEPLRDQVAAPINLNIINLDELSKELPPEAVDESLAIMHEVYKEREARRLKLKALTAPVTIEAETV